MVGTDTDPAGTDVVVRSLSSDFDLPDQGKRRDHRRHPLSAPYCAALVTATGSPRAGVRLLSMLKAPAPLPRTINSPPPMARFLRKLAISICCCSAGTAQKLWNTSVTGTRKMRDRKSTRLNSSH